MQICRTYSPVTHYKFRGQVDTEVLLGKAEFHLHCTVVSLDGIIAIQARAP